MTIKEMSYEECRKDFFLSLIKHAENKIKYWKRQKGYRCEIDENLSEAGEEISYCQDALNALEKQIPKKPIRTNCGLSIARKNFYTKCQICNHNIPAVVRDARMKFCPFCGQRLDWSDKR